jgi:hypothetical protein
VSDGSAGPAGVTPSSEPPDPFAEPPTGRPPEPDVALPAFGAPPPLAPPPAPPSTAAEPNRYFDGQRWMVWNGLAWVPEPPAVAPSSGSRRTLLVVVAIIVLGVVAGAVVLGLNMVNRNKDIVVPSSLGGLSKSTDASLITGANELKSRLASTAGGAKYDIGVYGSQGSGSVAFLVAARGGGTEDDVFSAMSAGGTDVPAPTDVGNSKCSVIDSQGATVCVRTSGSLVVMVVLSGSDTTKASGMVDEAWGQQ